MKIISLLFLCSCSVFSPKPQFDTSPPVPQEAPASSISKPQNNMTAAIEQTKSYYCIKNGDQFKKGITCQEHTQNIQNHCSKKSKSEEQVLDCMVNSLKI
jgi:hypothetical protein